MVEGPGTTFSTGIVSRERLIAEIRAISEEANHEAREALRMAAQECCVYATQEFVASVAVLREPLCSALVSVVKNEPDALGFDAALAQFATFKMSIDEQWSQHDAPELWSDHVFSVQGAQTILEADATNGVKTERLHMAEVLSQEPAINRGSVGHPHLCSRACIYFANDGCKNGQNCKFCHMPHPSRSIRLDKKNRTNFRSKPFGEVVALVVPILERQIFEWQASERAGGNARLHQQMVETYHRDLCPLLDSLLDLAAARDGVSQPAAWGAQPNTSEQIVCSGSDHAHTMGRISTKQSNECIAAINDSNDLYAPCNRKNDGLKAVLERMSIRSLLTTLQRLSPPDAEQERNIIDLFLTKLRHGCMLDSSDETGSAAQCTGVMWNGLQSQCTESPQQRKQWLQFQ